MVKYIHKYCYMLILLYLHILYLYNFFYHIDIFFLPKLHKEDMDQHDILKDKDDHKDVVWNKDYCILKLFHINKELF